MILRLLIVIISFFALAFENPSKDFSIYQNFQSRTDALNWYKEYARVQQANITNHQNKILSARHPAYKRPERILNSLWKTLETIYPAQTRWLQKPFILITKRNDLDGFVVWDRINKKIPAIIILTSAVTSNSVSEATLYSLIAHELGHYFLEHPNPNKDVEKYYKVDEEGGEPLGFKVSNQLAAQSILKEYLLLSNPASPFITQTAMDFPILYQGRGRLFLLLKFLVRKYEYSNPESCGLANYYLTNRVNSSFYKLFKLGEQIIEGSNEDFDNFNEVTLKAKEAIQSCLSGLELSFTAEAAEMLSVPEEEVNKYLFFNRHNFKQLEESEDLVSEIFKLTSENRTKMVELSTNEGMSQLRYYTAEEQADDFATMIAFYNNKAASYGYRFFLDFLPVSEKNSCLQKLESGLVPNYGFLEDSHHSACYRVYHSIEVRREFEENGIEEFLQTLSI